MESIEKERGKSHETRERGREERMEKKVEWGMFLKDMKEFIISSSSSRSLVGSRIGREVI